MVYLAVFFGGFFGAVARYYISKTSAKIWRNSFPLGTFIINATGSFLLGFLLTLFATRGHLPQAVTTGITVGFIGAYTTFSTFSLETFKLLENNEWKKSFYYIFLSIIVAILLSFLGITMAQVF